MENEKTTEETTFRKSKKEIRRAKRKVSVHFAFYIHLIAYVMVNVFLVVVNLLVSPDNFWVVWPMAGWGFGLLIHGFVAFAFSGMRDMHKSMLEKELNK